MKRYLISFIVIILFIVMLLFPKQTLNGASAGLLLWFNTVFPTLFPFMIISAIIVRSNILLSISNTLGPAFASFFHVSPQSTFAIISGLLCGYPMGAKSTADLLHKNLISKSEAAYLLSFCNNTSPAFILSFVLINFQNLSKLYFSGVIILLITPLICSQLFYLCYYKSKLIHTKCYSYSNESFITFEIIDDCITSSIESILKIGGYIILFSTFISLFQTIYQSDSAICTLFLSLLEISSGITRINASSFQLYKKWILSLFVSSFGGLCAIAQTNSMINDFHLPISNYIIEKLITAIVTSLLAFTYLIMLQMN